MMSNTPSGHRQQEQTRLPKPLTSLVGREGDVAAVCALLRQTDVRLVTLTGAGGVGKTRLALRVAEEVAESFPGGVWFVPLATVAYAELVGETIAHILGVEETGDRPLTTRIAAAFASGPTLLILDNFEHVVASAPLIATLLDRAPSLKVMATSRAALRITGEHAVATSPLPLPTLEPLPPIAELAKNDAVQLFTSRARATAKHFALNQENAAAVASLCHRLDGLPLAIELAAARTNVLAPAALLARIDHRLTLLTAGPRDQPRRLQTMRDAISWSYDLLEPAEQVLFRRLAIFVGGFTLEAAEAIDGQTGSPLGKRTDGQHEDKSSLSDFPSVRLSVLDGVASLVDKSLVRQVDLVAGEPRFDMLETIRQFGVELVEASGEAPALRQLHAAYYLDLAEEAAPALEYNADQTWLARFDAEHGNVDAALAWLTAHDRLEALRLAGAIVFYWYYLGYLTEGRRWLEELLATDDETLARAPVVSARALRGCGLLAQMQGDLDRAQELYESSRRFAQLGGDRHAEGTALSFLGGVLIARGRYDDATAPLEAALAHWLESANVSWLAHTFFHLGLIGYVRRDRDRAMKLFAESARLYDAIGSRFDTTDPLLYLGLLAIAAGDYPKAAEHLAEVMTRLKERGSAPAMASGLAGVATLATASARHLAAARLFGAGETLLALTGGSYPLPARESHEQAITITRRELGDEEWFAATLAGRNLRLDDALAEADALLTAVTAAASPAPTVDTGGLTERERDVLRLVAAGYTNPQIAEALFISRGTARTHVANLLAKLGVHTRTEAADLAHRRGLL